MNIAPIGIIRSEITEPGKRDWSSIISEIIINEELSEALSGIEGFSHIIVLYWMHKMPLSQLSTLKVHPRGDLKLPLTGVFACRSPARPNVIGLSTPKLLERRDNILKVVGLDAIDGSPVIDIKPHIPGSDCPARATTPDWVKRYGDEDSANHTAVK